MPDSKGSFLGIPLKMSDESLGLSESPLQPYRRIKANISIVFDKDDPEQTAEAKRFAVLIAAAPALLGMLEELEWIAEGPWLSGPFEDTGSCPVCHEPEIGRASRKSHAVDCALSALLKQARGEG